MVRLALAVSLLVATSNAFIVAPRKLAANAVRVVGAPLLRQHPGVLLQMSSEGEQKQPQSPTEETLEEEEEVEQEVEQVKEEQVKENPEITALKQEIASLESTLKASQQNIAYQTEKLEQYSKAGYARRVAEMETMRRARSQVNSSSREAAVASVLQNFLPVLDDLTCLQEKYGSDDFGKSFSALGGILQGVFKELGVVEYSIQPGDAVNKQRVEVVEEEYSEEFEKGTVIHPVSMGMELQGNVVRKATCVASLGSETTEETVEEQEEEAAAGENASEEEEGGEEAEEAAKE
jgi:molecular chaperone GrpE (heat shock protein)